MSRDVSPVLPATVQVQFDPSPCGGLSWSNIPTSYSVTTPLSKAGLGLGSGVANAIHSIRDSCHAVFLAAGGNPTNQGTMQSLVDQIGLDLWSWRSAAFDRVFNGLVVPDPNGLAGVISWTYRADRCTTRTTSAPIGGEPTIMGHSDPQNDCDSRAVVYGGNGTNAHATLTNGVLTEPRIKIYVEDGVLKWLALTPDTLTICPSTAGAMAMTTEDGDSMMMTD